MAGLGGRQHRAGPARAARPHDFNQILVLNHGRRQERGRHEALMAMAGGLYRRLVELQTLEEADPEVDPEAA